MPFLPNDLDEPLENEYIGTRVFDACFFYLSFILALYYIQGADYFLTTIFDCKLGT